MSKDYKNISLAEIASGSLKYGEFVAVEGEVTTSNLFGVFYHLTDRMVKITLDGMPFPIGVVPSLKQAKRTGARITVYGRYIFYEDEAFKTIRVHKVLIHGQGNLSVDDGTLEGRLSVIDTDGGLSIVEDD